MLGLGLGQSLCSFLGEIEGKVSRTINDIPMIFFRFLPLVLSLALVWQELMTALLAKLLQSLSLASCMKGKHQEVELELHCCQIPP